MAQLLFGLKQINLMLSADRKKDADVVMETLTNQKPLELNLPNEVFYALKRLWADEVVQHAYQRRNEFQLIDCTQ